MKNHFYPVLLTFIYLVINLLQSCSLDNPIPESPTDESLLKGKQLIALGNSITAPSNSWAYVVSQNMEMSLTNFAVSGAHWTDYYSTQIDLNENPIYPEIGHSNNTISNQVFRFLQMITPEGEPIPEIEGLPIHNENLPLLGTKTKDSTFDPYLVIISCGTNDSNNKEIGDISELDKPYYEADRKLLYGAIHWAVSVIRKYSPQTQIVLLTPIQRAYYPPTQLPLFVEAIMQAGKKLNCPTINMYEESGITEEEEAAEHKYLYDGLHPNTEGSELMGKVVSQYLSMWCKTGVIK